MLKFIALIVPFGLVALLIYAAFRPGRFRIQRSIRIQAPAARIFPLIDNFRRWQAWSPFETLDPSLQRDYSGPDSGRGALYEWEGKKLGRGSMAITESVPGERIAIDLEMHGRCEAQNLAEFTLEPRGDDTEVTWTMSGESGYVSKLIGLFINTDRMAGRYFEQGLAALKDLAEGRPEREALEEVALLRIGGAI